MKVLSKIFLSQTPFKGPGRLIFWVLVDLAFVVLAARGIDYYQTHNNVAETIFNLVIGLAWLLWLYNDLDRWYVPKPSPEPVPAQRSTTLEDVE